MDKKRFVPTDVGEWVSRFLVGAFSKIMDLSFTASVEDKPDAVARGEVEWKPVLREFWGPFKADVDVAADAERPTEATDEKCPECGKPMVIKLGKYGKFLGCSAYPECKNIQPLEKPKDTEIPCPECGKGTFLEKKSRRGKIFYSCSQYPKCKKALWNMPIDKPCPQCGAPFVTEKRTKRRGTEHVCASEACNWKEQVEAPEGS